MILRVFCDGGARGNPGPAGIGFVIKDEKGKILHQFGKTIGVATNNIAEYTAVIEALNFIKEKNLTPSRTFLFLDSQLVASQLIGVFKVKDEKLRMLVLRVRQKEAEVGGNVSYQHISRQQNWQADTLVNKALDTKDLH